MIRRRHSRSTCRRSSRAAARCPAGAAVALASRCAVSRSAGAITRSPQVVTCTSARPAARAAAAICPGVMAIAGRSPNTRNCVRPASTSPGLTGHRRIAMSEMLSAPPGRSTVALVEERLPGTEVERRLHADHPVDGAVGDRQPDGVADHRQGPSLPQPVPARRQLPLGDVHRYQPPGADRLGDQRVLGREPVAHVEDGSPGSQGYRERPHHPAAGGLGLAPGTGSPP